MWNLLQLSGIGERLDARQVWAGSGKQVDR